MKIVTILAAVFGAHAKECWRVDGYQPNSLASSQTLEAIVSSIPCDDTTGGYGWLHRVTGNMGGWVDGVGFNINPNVPGFSWSQPPNAPMYLQISHNDPYVETVYSGIPYTGYSYGNGTNTYYRGVLTYFGQYQGKPYFWSRFHFQSNYNSLVRIDGPKCAESPTHWWDNGIVIDAEYVSGQGCLVFSPLPGSRPFVYGNNFYVEARRSEFCLTGSFDGWSCYLGNSPTPVIVETNTPFSNDVIYVESSNGACPTVGGVNTMMMTTGNHAGDCYLMTVEIGARGWFSSNNNVYTTPNMCLNGGAYDGANCFFGKPPAGRTASIKNSGDFYYN